ncbi:MAG TPA: hypothetical protein VL995_21320 [Cellvibrio sp.]|nr:hypothetical protein [Cellvibrio sp.]
MNNSALMPIYALLGLSICLFIVSVVRWKKGLIPKLTAVITALFVAFIGYGLDHQCDALYVFC